MLNRYARGAVTRVMTPVARGLLRAGVSPDVVTLLGTLGVCVGAFAFFPRGQLFLGALVIALFSLSDLLDGTMARLSGRPTHWGAFLDSTLDRVGDAAIFGGLVLWYAGRGSNDVLAVAALYCLVAGALVSYAKARAEGLGMTCDIGFAERAERLLIILSATGLTGLGLRYADAVGLWVLAVASTVTLFQRVVFVRRQTLERPTSPR